MKEVLGDGDLRKMFENKSTSKDFNWRQVAYVQSCVKDLIGVGQ